MHKSETMKDTSGGGGGGVLAVKAYGDVPL